MQKSFECNKEKDILIAAAATINPKGGMYRPMETYRSVAGSR